MNYLSLSVYVRKWIVFIVNKLILIYFTWFVYAFVNYKYNVLLKKDDVFLMPLSTFVTLSRLNDGKEIRKFRKIRGGSRINFRVLQNFTKKNGT